MNRGLPEPTHFATADQWDAEVERLAAWIAAQEAKHGADNEL